MIIHNPILTGSFTVNGTDVASITSSAASIASLNSYTASLNARSSSFAITGSNTFVGNQVVSGSLTVSGSITTNSTLTAQTIVVQTITSSVDFVTGSTRFGSTGSNTHQFTGSVSVTGSFAVVTTGTELQVGATGVNLGNIVSDIHNTTGSLRISGSLFVATGSVGIGTLTPDIFGRGDALNVGLSTIGASDNMALSLNAGSSAGRGSQIYMGQGGTRHFTLSSNLTESTLGTTSNTPLIFTTNDSPRMRITNGGDVGIGTLSPSQYQHGGTNRVLEIQNPSSSANAQSHLILSTGATSNVGSIGSITFALPNTAGADKRAAMVQSLIESNSATTANGSLLFLTSNAGSLDTRMTITAAGRVFINNSSGVSLNGLTNFLSVSSTTYNLFDISRFSDNAFGPNFYLVKSRNGSIGGNTIVASGDNLGNIVWLGANGTGFTDAASIRAEVDGTPGASNDMPGRLVFTTTGDGSGTPTERMRITSGGNVLINTTTSNGIRLGQKLNVATLNDYAGIAVTTYAGAAAGRSSVIDLNKSRGTSDGSMTTVTNGDEIGYLVYRGSDGTNFLDLGWIRGVVDGAVSTNVMPGIIAFGTNGGSASVTERMRITSGGNVGIGTTSPGQNLSVYSDTNGDARISLTNPNTGTSARTFLYAITSGNRYTGLLAYGSGATGTTAGLSNASLGILEAGGDTSALLINSGGASSPIVFATNASERMRIASGGKVRINTTSTAQGMLYVSASASTDGITSQTTTTGYTAFVSIIPSGGYSAYWVVANNTAGYINHPTDTTTNYYTGPSDLRLKTNIKDWTQSVLPLFVEAKPKTYNHIADKDESIVYKGFIAQDMVDKFPEVYQKDRDGYYSNNPVGFIPYLVKAIQELKAEIDILKNK